MARWFVDRLPERGIPSVSLRKLLPKARFVGCPDWEVSGCTDDHRRLDPGQVFVAVRDASYDGHAFVRQALDRGAAGVVVEQPCPEAGRLQVVVDDSRSAHAVICQALAGDPSERLMTLGVTGTFGRTVTSLFVHSILEAAGLRCGLVGSLGWSDGRTRRPAGTEVLRPTHAWPAGAAGLASILAFMVDQSCAAGVLEVSADALERNAWRGSPSRQPWRRTSAFRTACPRAQHSNAGVPRPGCSARSHPAGPPSSMPMTRTPRSSVASTSTCAASPSA